jgi:MurNAc alpha-1-phosphate uridylyltransferase
VAADAARLPFWSGAVSEVELAALAHRLARVLRAGDLIALHGDLGAGKTTFARALIRSLVNDPNAEVPSPTFAIEQSYQGRFDIAHYDLYRLGDPSELDELGFEEKLAQALVLVEWPARAGDRLPADRIDLMFEEVNGHPEQRHLSLRAPSGIAGRLRDALPVAPTTAFIMAAGLGTRMRPLTEALPKPLVALAGRALIDRVLDRLVAAGITRAVVNVHYRADQLEAHLAARRDLEVVISDERAQLQNVGGALLKARGLLGDAPIYVHNSDSVWHEAGVSNLTALSEAFDATRMDALLLCVPRAHAIGYQGRGDFDIAGDGRLLKRRANGEAACVYAGVQILHPRLLDGFPTGPLGMNAIWDKAFAAGRIFGHTLVGTWLHVGSPAELTTAERVLAELTGDG